MPAFVDVSGTWRHLIPYVNISGAWRQIPQIYINVNNTWRPLWTYSWSIGGWGTCSATCGGGTQTRTVTCIRSGDNRTFGDNVCTAFGAGTKPPTSQPCNTQSCVSCQYSLISMVPIYGTGIITDKPSTYNCWVYMLNNANMTVSGYCTTTCTLYGGGWGSPWDQGVGGYQVYNPPACGSFYVGALMKEDTFWLQYQICGPF